MGLALLLHLLAAVIWVGGMFFAYVCVRPVAAHLLEPSVRLRLWDQVFQRFFSVVWVAIAVLVASGHYMVAQLGGMKGVGMHVHLMLGLGYLMVGLFLHVYFALFRKLRMAVSTQRWQAGGVVLNRMRQVILANLVLGLCVVALASGGKYLLG